MSQRKLVVDMNLKRQEAYSKLPTAVLQEALWEALETLQNAGLDVGAKAQDVLASRNAIKQKIPKPKK
jgi:hypothetical protein